MRTLFLAVVVLLCVAMQSAATAPSVAESVAGDLQTAREQIAASRFGEAAALLEALVPKTDSLPAAMQAQARTAIHFYAAVAYSGLTREEDAISHLQEALRITPSMRNIDPAKYDARFVSLFNRARSQSEGFETFDQMYPGYSGFHAQTRRDDTAWDGPALELLGTKEEKRRWQSTITPEERERFISDFWRVRDDSPQTAANEFRATFTRRVAFAEEMFGSPGQTGALTDRGRVFTLLGEPAMVQRRSLSSRDAITVMNIGSRSIEVGTIEYWFYTREQLPRTLAKPNMTFRFVSHQGIGDYVLQKDGLVMNALAMVSASRVRE